jgi:hypothetical protein
MMSALRLLVMLGGFRVGGDLPRFVDIITEVFALYRHALILLVHCQLSHLLFAGQ